MDLDGLQRLIEARSEDEHLEFKEAHGDYSKEKVQQYCCALANEGGGHFVLGVTDKPPRRVVGTSVFPHLDTLKHELLQAIKFRVDVVELAHPDGRVLVFTVPTRPRGHAWALSGRYLMRSGSSLIPMTPEHLQRIFDERTPDFSAEACEGAALLDLDPDALARFRRDWQRRTPHPLPESDVQLLADAELLDAGRVTYAALALLGTRQALGRRLANAEIIFEYRGDENAISYDDRREFRRGFLTVMDELWALINLRNPEFSFADGLFRRQVRALNEEAVREALLNAFCHRDYRNGGSIFVKQYPSRLVIISPGGFPEGVSPETVLFHQNPRNRRIAEALQRCGLVERSGQGADRMFLAAIREAKLPPDFSHSDAYQVELELHGQVRNPAFLRFLERLSQETEQTFSVEDLLVLDAVDRGLGIPDNFKSRVQRLLDLGAIERLTRARLILGARFHSSDGKPSEYTRKKGLDRETNKALLLEHITRADKRGSPMEELVEVLPALSRVQIKVLISELRNRGSIHLQGAGRGARWFRSISHQKNSSK